MSDDRNRPPVLDELGQRVQLERRRAATMETAEFRVLLDELLDGLMIEMFEADWQRVTIVNYAKELALAVRLDGADLNRARREMVAFFERKRRFYFDED